MLVFQSPYVVANTPGRVVSISVPLFVPSHLPVSIQQNAVLLHDFKVFNWFTDGYLAVISEEPLILADVRYLRSLHPLRPAWTIEFPTDLKRKHVYWQSNF